MYDPVIDSAHEYNDHQAFLYAREEAAKNEIIDALGGTEAQRDAMLARIGVPVDEYLEDYDADSEKLAEVYYTSIIDEWENPEY